MNGWLKFYRQSAENKIWKRDLIAWHLFETLLIYCKDGVWEGGRYQLAELAGLNPNTTYSALKRLEKAKMTTLSSNNKFSTISICNWSKYQANDNSADNNGATTAQHSYKNIRNKEYIDSTSLELLKKEFPTKNVNEEYEKAKNWLQATGKTYKNYVAFMRNWLRKAQDVPAKKSGSWTLGWGGQNGRN